MGLQLLTGSSFGAYDIKVKGCSIYGDNIKRHLSNRLGRNDIAFISYTVFSGISIPMLATHFANLAQEISARGATLVVIDDIYMSSLNPEDCEPTIPTLIGLKQKVGSCDYPTKSASNYKELLLFDALMTRLQEQIGRAHV